MAESYGNGRGRETAVKRSWAAHGAAAFLAVTLVAMNVAAAVPAGGENKVKEMKPCPSSPNCVSTQDADAERRMPPIPFTGEREAAQERLRKVIRAIPGSEINEDTPAYIAARFRSRVFGFVDEAEFVFDNEKRVIHFRSGARTGYYDFGVNRSRMERISAAFLSSN